MYLMMQPGSAPLETSCFITVVIEHMLSLCAKLVFAMSSQCLYIADDSSAFRHDKLWHGRVQFQRSARPVSILLVITSHMLGVLRH